MDIILLQPGEPDIVTPWAYPKLDGLPAAQPGGFDPSLCVPLTGFGQDLKAPTSANAPPVAAFTLVKPVDALSVKLYEFCLRARPLGEGQNRPTWLHRVSSGVLALSIALRDAAITDIQLQGQADGQVVERLTLTPSEMLWTYQVPTGGALHTGWSFVQNRPIAAFT